MARRFKKGVQVFSIHQAISLLELGRPLYFREKFMSAKFLENWSVVMLRDAVEDGCIYQVERVKND